MQAMLPGGFPFFSVEITFGHFTLTVALYPTKGVRVNSFEI